MKEKIIQTASELFLNLGFKSVTMDDIASHLSISKKTIYQHFKTKTELIDATTNYLFNVISNGIEMICSTNQNPIDEIFEIKKFVMHHLKDEKTSPQYQLQKYYPTIHDKLKIKQFEVTKRCVISNLSRGKELEIYRPSIDVEFISRLYVSSLQTIKNKDVFPLTNFSTNTLMQHFLEYHLRGICTEKGIIQLNQLLKNETYA